MPFKRAGGLKPVGPHFPGVFLNVLLISLFLSQKNPIYPHPIIPIYSSIDYLMFPEYQQPSIGLDPDFDLGEPATLPLHEIIRKMNEDRDRKVAHGSTRYRTIVLRDLLNYQVVAHLVVMSAIDRKLGGRLSREQIFKPLHHTYSKSGSDTFQKLNPRCDLCYFPLTYPTPENIR